MDFHRGPGGAPMDPEGGVRPRLGLLVQRRLLSLHDRGFCTPDELDRRAVDMLAELPEEDALATLNEFENADRQSLKNINGFLVSIIQKYRRVPPVGGVAALGAGPVGFNAASLPPPPPTMPADLMYGFGDVEYVPEMPIQYVKHMQALQQQQSQQHQHHPRRAFGEKPPPVALVHVPPSERVRYAYYLYLIYTIYLFYSIAALIPPTHTSPSLLIYLFPVFLFLRSFYHICICVLLSLTPTLTTHHVTHDTTARTHNANARTQMLNEYGFSPPMQEILESLLAMKKINVSFNITLPILTSTAAKPEELTPIYLQYLALSPISRSLSSIIASLRSSKTCPRPQPWPRCTSSPSWTPVGCAMCLDTS